MIKLFRYIVVTTIILLSSQLQAQQEAGFANFKKLAGHMGSNNTYYLALLALREYRDYKKFMLDQDKITVLVETHSGQQKEIDREEALIINSLGSFTTEAQRQYTLFRFNLLIDTSGSVDDTELNYIINALTSFFKHIPVVYEAQIIKFSSSVDVSSFSKDESELISWLQPSERNQTSLFDAIDKGLSELKRKDREDSQEVPFRFSVVLTDGKDTSSQGFSSAKEFIRTISAEVNESDIPLLIVGVTSEVDEQTLREISRSSSGGVYVPILHFTDLDEAFQKITEMLMQTYIFRIRLSMPFDEVKRLLVVKKSLTGKYETLQDINLK